MQQSSYSSDASKAICELFEQLNSVQENLAETLPGWVFDYDKEQEELFFSPDYFELVNHFNLYKQQKGSLPAPSSLVFAKYMAKLPIKENVKMGKFLRQIESTLLKFKKALPASRGDQHEEEVKQEQPALVEE